VDLLPSSHVGAACHFDLKEPLRPGVLSASGRAAGVQLEAPLWQRQNWHAGQLSLMPESGYTSAGVSQLAADPTAGYRFRSHDLRRRSTQPALFRHGRNQCRDIGTGTW
jgi:hypothetical protein